MPFDSTTFRQPAVTILPPQSPERGGGPRRIHIEIQIIDRRAQTPQRRGYRIGSLTLLALCLALALFGSRPRAASSWQSYREGFVTRHQGTGMAGDGPGRATGSGSPPTSTPPDRMASSGIAGPGSRDGRRSRSAIG